MTTSAFYNLADVTILPLMSLTFNPADLLPLCGGSSGQTMTTLSSSDPPSNRSVPQMCADVIDPFDRRCADVTNLLLLPAELANLESLNLSYSRIGDKTLKSIKGNARKRFHLHVPIYARSRELSFLLGCLCELSDTKLRRFRFMRREL